MARTRITSARLTDDMSVYTLSSGRPPDMSVARMQVQSPAYEKLLDTS